MCPTKYQTHAAKSTLPLPVKAGTTGTLPLPVQAGTTGPLPLQWANSESWWFNDLKNGSLCKWHLQNVVFVVDKMSMGPVSSQSHVSVLPWLLYTVLLLVI